MTVQSQFIESIDYNGHCISEIDSRADTFCFGKGWVMDSYTGIQVDVGGFHDSMETVKNVPVATCLSAFDHPNGPTYILVANKVLFLGKLQSIL